MLKKIVDISKEPLSYFSDLSTVFVVVYSILLSLVTFVNHPLTIDLRNKLQEMSSVLKAALSIFLIFILYYLLNRMYNKSKFLFEGHRLSSNLEKERINQSVGLLIKNYRNIIPSTTIIREIFKEFEERAKQWSLDSYLAHQELSIWVKKDQISEEMIIEFFSKKKSPIA